MSALGFKANVDSFCMLSHLCDPQSLFSPCTANVSASIGGGLGLEPTTSKSNAVYLSTTPAHLT